MKTNKENKSYAETLEDIAQALEKDRQAIIKQKVPFIESVDEYLDTEKSQPKKCPLRKIFENEN